MNKIKTLLLTVILGMFLACFKVLVKLSVNVLIKKGRVIKKKIVYLAGWYMYRAKIEIIISWLGKIIALSAEIKLKPSWEVFRL